MAHGTAIRYEDFASRLNGAAHSLGGRESTAATVHRQNGAAEKLADAAGTAAASQSRFWFLTVAAAEITKHKMPPRIPVQSSRQTNRLGPAASIWFSTRASEAAKFPRPLAQESVVFPSETSENIFEFFRSLAQKQLSPAQPLRKIIPRLAKNCKILRRKRTPRLEQMAQKRENSFLRTTPQNSPHRTSAFPG